MGFSLIHAGFLAAGAAVAVPLIIHLLFRQKTRTVMIGSVRFLHQVVKEHRRRRRVRQWLLLALRMLAVLLLALLFARPYLDESHRRGLEQEVVLLVDRSASMQAASSSRETSFDRAVTLAKEELGRLDENVIVHVALFDSTGVREVPLEDLSKATATEAATDYGAALDWARDVLASSERSNRRIVLFSDLQKSGLPRAKRESLPEGMELVLRNVGDALPRNVAVESAEAIRTEIRPDGPVTVRVVVHNHAPLPIGKLPLTLEVERAGGKKLSVKRTIDVPSHGRAAMDIPLDIEDDGLYRGHVAIAAEDALALDNRRWLAFEARHPDRVLLVDGQQGRSVFANETYFLETALRLQTEESGGQIRSFEAERIVWEAGEGFPRLDGYRAVVLTNVRRLSAEDGRRLDDYVRHGGSLLIFAGDQVSGESLAPLTTRGLLPGKLADDPVDGRLRIDQWDKQHPALACFADPQQGDLRRVEFHRALPLASLSDGSKALLQSGNHVVAAERTIEKGRCLYVGGTADREWTELPRTPMYVPFMRQLLAYLTDQLAERSAVTSRLVSKPGDKSGIAASEKSEGRWAVTNIDPQESALERIAPEEFQKLAGGEFDEAEAAAQQLAGLTLPADSLRSDEIWTTIAWILLAVLAIETLVAGRVHA